MRRSYRHAVSLAAVMVFMGACFYDAGDTCDGDVCINHAPVAVISGRDDDGALRVGSAAEVLISARDSNDPDGDALTYAWSATEPCAAAVTGPVDTQELRLTGLAVGATCDVSLTVTDARGLAGSATATLMVRNVGGYVSREAPCVATFDIANEAPQGTAASPFCTIDQALLAARDLHLAEVSLQTGPHDFTGPMLVDFPVRVRGGYQRADAPWASTNIAATSLILNQGSATTDARIEAVGGVTLALQDLLVRRNGRCNADCALVSGNDASLELHGVRLGSTAVAADANDATGVSYASIAMTTPDTAADTRRRLEVREVAITGSANANISVAIQVNGRVDVGIEDVVIRETAPISVGIRTLNAGDVSIAGARIDIDVPRVDGSAGFGIIDGERENVALGDCGSQSTCRASGQLTVQTSIVEVAGGDRVFGINALGSARLTARGNTITTEGQQAWGVLTSGVRGVLLENQVVSTVTRVLRGDQSAYAVGISDNFEGSFAETGGSSDIAISGCTVDAHVQDAGVTRAAGINLVRSANVIARNTTVRVSGGAFATSSLESVAGVRTLGVSDVTFTEGSVSVESLTASEGAAAFADGKPLDLTGAEPSGSTGLTIQGVGMRTAIAGDVNTLAACVVIVGSQNVSIIGDRGLTTMVCTANGPGNVYGVYSSANTGIIVRDNVMSLAAASMMGGLFGARHVGVHDGARPATDLARASSGLVVSGNRITLNEADRVQIGVRVRGEVGINGQPIIANNLVTAKGSINNIGVLLHAAQATVALNSVRLNGCTVCAAPYAVGVYLMHTDGLNGTYVGNVLSVTAPMDPQYRPAFVRHSVGVVAPAIGTVGYTLYQSETGGSEPPLIAAVQNASTDIVSPAGMTPYSEDIVGGTGNVPIAPSYCPDGIHGDPDGEQRGAATGMVQGYGTDLDGEERELSKLDAGADTIAAVCP